MDRRSFIKAVGAVSALVIGDKFFGEMHQSGSKLPASEEAIFISLEKSIKAGFGAGFRLLEYKNQQRSYVAKVEHLENHYIVTSNDKVDWTIISSDIA